MHEEQTSTATGAAEHHLGPRVLAFATELKMRLGVPYGKIVEILWQRFGIKVTAGALVHAMERLGRRAEPTIKEMKKALRKEEILNAEETGWRVMASSWWLWVVCSEVFTIFEIVPHRCASVVQEMLGKDFKGILMRDGMASYDAQMECEILRCLLHLKRNAQDLEDAQSGVAAEEASLFVLWLEGVFDLRARADELTEQEYAQEAGELAHWLDEYVKAEHESDSNTRFTQRLGEIRKQIVPIVENPQMPATNNLAERQIRPAVVHRKISAGNKTEKGARTLAILASLAATCRQQARDFTQLVQRILRCAPGEASAFWLEPVEASE